MRGEVIEIPRNNLWTFIKQKLIFPRNAGLGWPAASKTVDVYL